MKPDNNTQTEPMRIRKNTWYVCIHDDSPDFKNGNVYLSRHDDSMPVDSGVDKHYSEHAEFYFREATYDEIPELIINPDVWYRCIRNEYTGDCIDGTLTFKEDTVYKGSEILKEYSQEDIDRYYKRSFIACCIVQDDLRKLTPFKYESGQPVYVNGHTSLYVIKECFRDWPLGTSEERAVNMYVVGEYGYENNTIMRVAEGNITPWTLETARPGECLAKSGKNDGEYWIGVLKSRCEDSTIRVYFYTHHDREDAGFGMDTRFVAWDLRPATQEERMILMDKLEKSGYRWDSAKLSLEKLGEKKVLTPIFKPGDTIAHKIYDLRAHIDDIRDGKYILSGCSGSYLPIEWQEAYARVPVSNQDMFELFNVDVDALVAEYYKTHYTDKGHSLINGTSSVEMQLYRQGIVDGLLKTRKN